MSQFVQNFSSNIHENEVDVFWQRNSRLVLLSWWICHLSFFHLTRVVVLLFLDCLILVNYFLEVCVPFESELS